MYCRSDVVNGRPLLAGAWCFRRIRLQTGNRLTQPVGKRSRFDELRSSDQGRFCARSPWIANLSDDSTVGSPRYSNRDRVRRGFVVAMATDGEVRPDLRNDVARGAANGNVPPGLVTPLQMLTDIMKCDEVSEPEHATNLSHHSAERNRMGQKRYWQPKLDLVADDAPAVRSIGKSMAVRPLGEWTTHLRVREQTTGDELLVKRLPFDANRTRSQFDHAPSSRLDAAACVGGSGISPGRSQAFEHAFS